MDKLELNEEQKKKLAEPGLRASDILLSLNEHLDVWRVGREIFVQYENGEVSNVYFLVSEFGRGYSFEEACEDYLSRIRGKTLVFNACSEKRREVRVLG